MSKERQPSLFGGLLWTGLGLLFLLRNLGIGLDFWSLAGRYWPVLLILLGLGKVLGYVFHKQGMSISTGEIVGILLLLLVGSAISRFSETDVGHMFRNMPLQVGDTSLRPGQWIGESHAYNEERTYPLESAIPIYVENNNGSIILSPGSDREIHVRLKKLVYADELQARDIAAEIHVDGRTVTQRELPAGFRPESDPARSAFLIKTERDVLNSRNYVFNTDLEILVPKNSELHVNNTYGEINVSGLNGTLDLSTTHRPLEVRDCSGKFKISNNYAESRLTNLEGNITLAGRGRMYLEKIKGDVDVSNEYSPMEIFDVDGKVVVASTEGNIRLEKITKAVVIKGLGTQVRASNLKDSLKLSTSHRNVELSGIALDVSLDSSYADLKLNDIKGNVEIHSRYDTISADDIGGRLKLEGRGSGMRANNIRGPLDVQTNFKDVIVNDFADSCNISNEYAAVSLSAASLGKGDVNVKNRNGKIELFLPDNASCSIEAVARNGRVDSDYAGLEPGRNDGTTGVLKSSLRSGVPRIILNTDYSNIQIYRTREKKNSRVTGH
jgi:DUF4097 and DUF4098 domain-containing protein YvlB